MSAPQNKLGLVIGKFYPPHKGHKYLIDYASAHSRTVIVLVCDSPKYAIPAHTRKKWLQEIHPAAEVRVIPDIDDDNNSLAWAHHTLQFLGRRPDIVFTSEAYGEKWAQFMGARHCMVDQLRARVPISATMVRADMLRQWQYLEPPVRQDLALRIVVVGAESTGTTTLSQDLAQHYKAPCVPELGRTYSDALLHVNHDWTNKDFAYIGREQQRLENKLARKSNGLLICDTNATATQLWQKRYLGHVSSAVVQLAAKDKADYYFLTGDEIPFVQDGTREGGQRRHTMHQDFVELLARGAGPYALLRGSRQHRLEQAITTIDKLITRTAIADPASYTFCV